MLAIRRSKATERQLRPDLRVVTLEGLQTVRKILSGLLKCRVVLVGSTSDLSDWEKNQEGLWKFWHFMWTSGNLCPLEPSMKGKALLQYLWRWQAEAIIWDQWCLVTLHIQLLAVLSFQTVELRVCDLLFSYPVVLAVQPYFFQKKQLSLLLRYLDQTTIWYEPNCQQVYWIGGFPWSRLTRRSERAIHRKEHCFSF